MHAQFHADLHLIHEQLERQRIASDCAFRQIEYTFSAIDAQMQYHSGKEMDVAVERLEQLENTLINKLQEQEEQLKASQERLRGNITEGISFLSQSWKQEQRQERSLITNLSSLMRAQFSTKQRPASLQSALRIKLKHKTGSLTSELKKMQDKNTELKSRAQAELKQAMKLLDEIEEGRQDRQAKEEQILAKVQELAREEETGAGSRTQTSKTVLE